MRTLCSTLMLLLCACATTAEQKGPPPPKPAARSSLSAMLLHSDELKLNDQQYTQIRQIDEARESRVQSERAAIDEQRSKPNGPPKQNNPFAGPNTSQQRRMREQDRDAADARADEADTQAFFAAEPLLSPEQVDVARKIASQWRDEMNIWRDAMKRRGLR